jgi:hypothetical protein
MSEPGTAADERADLLQSLATQRRFLRHTTRGLTDEQAAQRPTVSALTLGGLIKLVALAGPQWMDFMVVGPAARGGEEQATMSAWMVAVRGGGGVSVAGLVEA